MKDFIVNISRLTETISQRGFGLILIAGTSRDLDYTIYNNITEVANDFTITDAEYLIANRIFLQSPAPQQVAIISEIQTDMSISVGEHLVNILANTVDSNNEWFGLVTTDYSIDTIERVSAWIDTQEKIYAVTTDELAELMYSQIVNSDNTIIAYHDDVNNGNYVAESLLIHLLVRTIGSTTGKFRQLQNITESNVTVTELNELHNNNVLAYVEKMGVLQTSEGKVSSGEYIDVVLGTYFIKFRMEEELARLAINTPKIPYSNQGIALLSSVAEKILKLATTQTIILEDEDGNGVYEISTIRREDTPIADVANRIYNGISWSAVLAGAIHEGIITGVLTLE